MINLSQRPLPDPQATALHQWLNQPECRQYQEYLSNLAAARASEAVNLLCSADPNDKEDTDKQDALVLLKEAKSIEAARKLLETMAFKEYSFHPYNIRQEIVINQPET